MNEKFTDLDQQIKSIQLLININELLAKVLNDILYSNSPVQSEGE